jgi:CTP synthase
MLLQEEFIFRLLKREEFFRKTVQVVPHITNEIKDRMQLLGNSGDYDIVITEIGGTVGDMNPCLIESVRQMVWDLESIMLS